MPLRLSSLCRAVRLLGLVSCFALSATTAYAQPGQVIQDAERALCDGDDAGAERNLKTLLEDPGLARSVRFDALMMLAEVYFQRSAMEQFLAATDSAARLIGLPDGLEQEAWAQVETNRSRHAFFAMQYASAVQLGEAALARYRRAPDRSRWKQAFRIHQALATAYRIGESSFDPSGSERTQTLFAHFDTALVLVHARKDALPYWEASIWRSISNAAMDHMAHGIPDHASYGLRCRDGQQEALAIMQRYHSGNRLERVMLMNLHGLYLVYDGKQDSAMRWLTDAQDLIRSDVWKVQDERFFAAWLLALRWKAMIFEGEPWRSDTRLLDHYLNELMAAEPLFARYAAKEVTAQGLFTRDRYGYSPFTAIVATAQRLWQLTKDLRYIDHALRATEKARRDPWNNAQLLRGRPELTMPDPPADMLSQVRHRMSKNEGLLQCVDYGLGQVGHRVITLAVTRDSVAFNECDFNQDWSCALDMPQVQDATLERRAFHLLYDSIYAPVRHLLQGSVTRLHVIGTGEFAKLSFDALLADTGSTDIRQCHPLVQVHAISYPYFLLPPEEHTTEPSPREPLYLAPVPESGALTDLRPLREALARWHNGAIPGTLDSSLVDAALALERMQQANLLVWGGHCGGNIFLNDEPLGYLSASANDSTSALRPSQLLELYRAPALVIHAACQSGVFYPYGSSGSVSFARAFLFAGSRSVVAAQHIADERSSIRVLGFLLDALAEGKPMDLALQKAKLDYLEQATSAEDTRPLYWATWQLWGDPTLVAPATGPLSTLQWITAVSLSLIGLFWVLWKRRAAL